MKSKKLHAATGSSENKRFRSYLQNNRARKLQSNNVNYPTTLKSQFLHCYYIRLLIQKQRRDKHVNLGFMTHPEPTVLCRKHLTSRSFLRCQ